MIEGASNDTSVRSSTTAASFAGSGIREVATERMRPPLLSMTDFTGGTASAPSAPPSARMKAMMPSSPKISVSNTNAYTNTNTTDVNPSTNTNTTLSSAQPWVPHVPPIAGSTTSASASASVSSSVPNSMFHYPRAPNANTESDFNIFTGEPQDHGVGHRATR